MRLFLIFLLVLLFSLLGVIVYAFYLYRYKLYSDLIYICKNLKNKISFTKIEINNILEDCFDDISKTSKLFITKRNSVSMFLKKDNLIVDEFFSSLGKGDVDFEMKNISYYENIFSNISKEAQEKVKSSGLMYLKLFIGFGLIIGILLL